MITTPIYYEMFPFIIELDAYVGETRTETRRKILINITNKTLSRI